jgi:hypothetical protein
MKTEIVITSQLESGTAFGLVTSTGEGVFVPANVANSSKAAKGLTMQAVLVPNKGNVGDIPHKAAFIDPIKQDAPAGGLEEAFNYISGNVYVTNDEVAAEMQVLLTQAEVMCQSLYDAGRICMAKVTNANGDAGLTLWALNKEQFLEDQE